MSSGEAGPPKAARASPTALDLAGEVGRELLIREEPFLASGEWGGDPPPPLLARGEVGRASGDRGRISLCSDRGDLVPWLDESKISSSRIVPPSQGI